MKKTILFLFVFSFGVLTGFSQGFTRQTYHDQKKENLKEVYQVKDTLRNVLHGRYVSYYLNGNIESKGQFTNNETTGVWEFFYETGNLKMRGILRQNANYGLWEYFYESGQKSMEGSINGKLREGEWKSYYEDGQIKEIGEYTNNKRTGLWKNYFEDGTKKGEIEYTDDFGRYTEFYHSGKILSEGPRSGTKNAGQWRYFAEDGTLQSEGEFSNGKKNGSWTNYFPSGKISSKGDYVNDDESGNWEYFFEDGAVKSSGEFSNGQKSGRWKSVGIERNSTSEITYDKGSGEYREYYLSGKLKSKGNILKNKKQGKWEYFREDGKLEGDCTFDQGKGMYHGYYPNGNLQTKGILEDDLKVGTWEMYENDGKLSGYYKPFYDEHTLGKEITSLANKTAAKKSVKKSKAFNYFDERSNEFHGVIVATNPVFLAAGRLPLGVEFYLEERIGHEFEFVGIRDPFFKSDDKIATNKLFERGYAISIKQKFYNPLNVGMWYFGQEIRFTNMGHFVNQPIFPNSTQVFTVNAVEQRIEWGAMLGYRIMRKNDAKGFTIDAFIAGNVGYRGFNVDPDYSSYFAEVNQNKFSTTFHFGLNFGNVFSY